jgi:two-component system phosphate regulon sensor histidine kinase PhoR
MGDIMSPAVKSFLVIAARVTAFALLAGVPAGLIRGATLGFALGGAVLLLAFTYYAWKLAQLHHWLEDPQAATLPEAGGMWGDVLGKLYRLIKQERVSQKSLSDALSRFQQAASALPDGAMMLDQQNNIVWLNPTAETHWGISLANDRMQTVTYFIRYPGSNSTAGRYGERWLKVQRKDMAGASRRSAGGALVPFGGTSGCCCRAMSANASGWKPCGATSLPMFSLSATPITVMAGFRNHRTGASNRLLEKSLAHMTSQAMRMQRLVEDLLTLSRLEDISHRPVTAPVNVPELLRSLIIDAGHLSSGRHRFNSDLADDWLLGNRDELASAFGNLISNAVRYTPDGSEIHVLWGIHNGAPVLRVRDNGEGIAAEHIPRLTERFYRVDRGRSRATGGTGLGLAIVKHALIRHRARLEIESSQDAASHGTQFSILLPAEAAASRTAATGGRCLARHTARRLPRPFNAQGFACTIG